MLVSASTTFALRCPSCGKLETATLSWFDLGGGRSVKLSCPCGGELATVAMRHGKVSIRVPCYLCEGMHFLYYSPKSFWEASLEQVTCAETDLQMGAFGGFDEVEAYARPDDDELDRLLNDAAFDDYFDHREVMFQTLNRIHSLAEVGKVTCKCGNHKLTVDIYPDRLELTCDDCGRKKAVKASTQDDLANLERAACIEVGDDTSPRRKGSKK